MCIPALARLARFTALSFKPCPPGVFKSGPSLKELRGGFTEMEFANGRSFDHLDAGAWSKLAPFVILGPVPCLLSEAPRLQSSGTCVCTLARGKPAPSLRLAMSLRACRWRGIPSFAFLLVFVSNARTPKWGRRIQANEKKGHRPAPTPLNEMRFCPMGLLCALNTMKPAQ